MPAPVGSGQRLSSLHTLHTYSPSPTVWRQRRAVLQTRRSKQVCRAEVNYATGAPPTPKPPPAGLVQDIRKFLLQTGWQRAWIDGISDRLNKREFDTTVERCKEVITYLEGLGIPTNSVCNMAARAARILGQDEQQLKAVVSFIEGRGVTGQAVGLVLSGHPKLLLYSVSSDGKVLEMGRSRAQVDVVEKNGQRHANVSYWRDGAAFVTAPLSPWKPGNT